MARSGERPSAISMPIEAPPPPAKLSTIRGAPTWAKAIKASVSGEMKNCPPYCLTEECDRTILRVEEPRSSSRHRASMERK